MRIPSLMNARYRSSGQAQVSNYLDIEDIIQRKKHLGRLLPKNKTRREVLEFWVRHSHPAFATVYRYLDWDGQYLAILPDLTGYRPLANSCATKMKAPIIAKIFLNLVHGCKWLHHRGFRHPQLSLEHVMVHENGRVRLLGHEAAHGLKDVLEAETVPHLDVRYAAPEVMARQSPSEKSDVFELAAVFYHFLTGKPYMRRDPAVGVRASNRRLKKHWDALFAAMLSKDPSERPQWEAVWRECCETLTDDPAAVTAACPTWQPATGALWDEELEKILGETMQGPRMVSMMLDSNRFGRMRLDPFARTAEKKGFLVVHTWRDRPVPTAYESINEVIALVKLGFLAHIDRPDLEQAFLPLSEWQSADDLKKRWRHTLTHLVKSMVPGLYRGIVLILEGFHHMDTVSLETLMTFSGWMAPTPFLLVLTGPSLAHPHFRQFRDQWQHPQQVLAMPKPLATSVAAWHQAHAPKEWGVDHIDIALAQVGYREAYFLQWLRDPDGGQHLKEWMAQLWSWLKPKEQLILKMLACSVRPLKVAGMEQAFSFSQLGKHVDQLVAFGLVTQNEDGYLLAQPIWAQWMKETLNQADFRHSFERLLAYEQSKTAADPIQIGFLAAGLQNQKMAQSVLGDIVPQFLKTWNSEDIRLLHKLAVSRQEPFFQEFVHVAQFLRWQLPMREVKPSLHPLLALATKAQQLFVKDGFVAAQKTLIQLLGKRGLPAGLKAWTFTQLAEGYAYEGDDLAVAKIWRQWCAFDKSRLDPDEMDCFTARIAGAMVRIDRKARSLDIAIAGLPRHLRAWCEALRAWQAGLFDDEADSLARLLNHLPNHSAPIWLGRIHQSRGNTLYRQYRPAEAIRCYEEARQYFSRVNFAEGLVDISFNLASAENLAGRFASSVARFQPLLKKAELDGDEKTQSQIIFNLMVCALYQNDVRLFDHWCAAHKKLTHKGVDPTEAVRRMTTWLQTALCRSKDEIMEVLEALEHLVPCTQMDSVLEIEVRFARRWARFALGQDAPPPVQPYPELVRWRHQLLDALQGLDGQQFQALTQTIGRGFLGAVHFFILSTVISRRLMPETLMDQALLRAYQEHAQACGANYSRFINQFFGHLRGLGDIPPEAWRRAIQVLSRLEWHQTEPESFETALVSALHETWPFSERGACKLIRDQWRPLSSETPHPLDAWVGDHLNLLQVAAETEPITTQFAHPVKLEVRPMLLLPVRHSEDAQAMLWFLAHEKQEKIGMRLDLLLRFYAKLFEWVFQAKAEPAPKAREIQTKMTPTSPTLGMVGNSGRMLEVKEKILQYAPSNLNMFVYGESGTGKELAANAIHQHSRRNHKPFRAINCAHYPENLVEAELFGHARGAYTGATLERAGLLEQVDGGTLFLDEIGDINNKVQSLLLRVIQEGEFSRIGETRVRKVDIRFVIATNKNLHQAIDDALFREDLYFRLVEVELQLPALRERFEDLPALASHFVAKHHPSRKPQFDRRFFDHLRGYHWPGNVRELESYIRKLLVEWPNQKFFGGENVLPFLRARRKETSADQTLEALTNRCRKQLILSRLQQYGWNRTRAAESLGISRQQLSNLISKYHLSPPKGRD